MMDKISREQVINLFYYKKVSEHQIVLALKKLSIKTVELFYSLNIIKSRT